MLSFPSDESLPELTLEGPGLSAEEQLRRQAVARAIKTLVLMGCYLEIETFWGEAAVAGAKKPVRRNRNSGPAFEARQLVVPIIQDLKPGEYRTINKPKHITMSVLQSTASSAGVQFLGKGAVSTHRVDGDTLALLRVV